MPIQGTAAGNELVAGRGRAPTGVSLYPDGCEVANDSGVVRYYPDPKGGMLALPLSLKERVVIGGIGNRERCRMRFLIGPENRYLVRVNEREEGGLVFHLPEDEAALFFVSWYEFPPRTEADIDAAIARLAGP